MSPQPKWRVSAERLAKWLEIAPNVDERFDTAKALGLDLRDARAEIDTLQAAVRELRAALGWALQSGIELGTADPEWALETKGALARTDKLLPEDEQHSEAKRH